MNDRYHNRRPPPRNNPGIGNLLLIPAGILLLIWVLL